MAAGSAALADAHRLAQHRLGINTVRLLRAIFPLLDLTNIDATTERWIIPTTAVVRFQHARSARLAADYLTAARQLDLGPDPDWLPTLAAANLEQIITALRVTGPVRARQLTAAGRPLPDVRRMTFQSAARSGMRLALGGGRNTITSSIANDRDAKGWSRVASGQPCAFCALLVSRGPVYSQHSVQFRAHDGCSCSAMAIYGRSGGWTDQARKFRDLYNDVAKGTSDPLNAFRRAIESA